MGQPSLAKGGPLWPTPFRPPPSPHSKFQALIKNSSSSKILKWFGAVLSFILYLFTYQMIVRINLKIRYNYRKPSNKVKLP